MKVCPKCNAHYQDDTFFCLQDGTPLNTTDSAQSKEEIFNQSNEETVDLPSKQTVIKITPDNQNKSAPTISRTPIQNEFVPKTEIASNQSNTKFLFTTVGLAIFLLLLGSAMGAGWWYIQNLQNSNTIAQNPKNKNTEKNSEDNESPKKATVSTPKPIKTKETKEENPKEEPVLDTTQTEEPKAPPTETPTPTPKPIKKGKIQGKLTYPSDRIPSNMHICVQNVSTRQTACSNRSKNGDVVFKLNRSAANYSVTLPSGTYYIYATVPGQGKAFYTEFVRCGMSVNCKSHRKIPIKARAGKTTSRITIGDWYDF